MSLYGRRVDFDEVMQTRFQPVVRKVCMYRANPSNKVNETEITPQEEKHTLQRVTT